MRKRCLKAEGEHIGGVEPIRKKRTGVVRSGRFGCFRLFLLFVLLLAAAALFLDGDDPEKIPDFCSGSAAEGAVKSNEDQHKMPKKAMEGQSPVRVHQAGRFQKGHDAA